MYFGYYNVLERHSECLSVISHMQVVDPSHIEAEEQRLEFYAVMKEPRKHWLALEALEIQHLSINSLRESARLFLQQAKQT